MKHGQVRYLPGFWEFGWLGKKDSNLRMPESKSGALTNLATPQQTPPAVLPSERGADYTGVSEKKPAPKNPITTEQSEWLTSAPDSASRDYSCRSIYQGCAASHRPSCRND